ncbi:MAG: chorismate mutase [Robiginitomaculum sp.]|nr:MAG: chorismate mutase [Robiginitomaculum sp.]
MIKDAKAKPAKAKPAKKCMSMDEVRAGVDAVDRELVALIVRRQAYMEAAARIKTDRAAVYDAVRIEDVVSKVKAEASRQGLSIDIAEPVWREMIKRSIAYEFEAWDRLRNAG